MTASPPSPEASAAPAVRTLGETTTADVADWWATGVSRMAPGELELRGRPVQELIGTTGFAATIWLMLRGELPSPQQAQLLEAALVASVDHGPQAPSIAVARMAITCGVGLNNAMATGVNLLGDVHGGAGQQCVELLTEIRDRGAENGDIDVAATEVVARWRAQSRYLPGFGHRFHPVDPRRQPLLSLVETAVAAGTVPGEHLRAAYAIENLLAGRSRPVPMNIDGATAVIYAELGFPAPLARGLFVLSRSVGILAHAWEESQQGRRNKGPMPPAILPSYVPPAAAG
ncbi:citryl-CoA lyase [Rugosimonospora africana]|uniref:citrate synthase (unknown stereospecificity) n=1 Tax=Rugosimonospora africana TaxID=556532 RepID=A0A8J3QT48_9ACTN|nr:citryl-CoA lyase [Rugosimonospora africana]GIH15991.1 citryl-CoA lyase [Rugosimonospora africana]